MSDRDNDAIFEIETLLLGLPNTLPQIQTVINKAVNKARDNETHLPLDAAQRLMVRQQVRDLGLAGKRIRILRAITFEGEAEAVLRQIARSQGVGRRDWPGPNPKRPSTLSMTIAQGEIEIIEPAQGPPRIHVADLDPDTLVGIAPCDDGSDGWVIMGVQPDPDEPDKEIVAPIGDEHGQIVYLDINDAAEVLRTGKVWKHDMGEGEPDASNEADTTLAGQEG